MARWPADTFAGVEWDEPSATIYPLMNNTEVDIKMVEWLEFNFEWDEPNEYGSSEDDTITAHRQLVNHTMATAVQTGQLDVVKFLYNHKLLEPSCKFIFSAAEHGHLDVVKWLHAMESLCSTSAIVFAAKGGHLEIVKCQVIRDPPQHHKIAAINSLVLAEAQMTVLVHK